VLDSRAPCGAHRSGHRDACVARATCTALLIAAFSFFLGQAKVIPKPIRIFPLLLIPPLVVLATLLYWLWRVRVRQSLRGGVVASSNAVVEAYLAPRS